MDPDCPPMLRVDVGREPTEPILGPADRFPMTQPVVCNDRQQRNEVRAQDHTVEEIHEMRTLPEYKPRV